jgi:hypothetical protein
MANQLVRTNVAGTIQSVDTAVANSIAERDANGDSAFKHPRADLAFVGNGIQLLLTAKSADWTLTEQGGFLYNVTCSSVDITASLPAAASYPGMIVGFKKADSTAFHVIIDGNAAETINGDAQIFLTVQNEVALLQSDGTNWVILLRHVPVTAVAKAAAFTAGGDGTVYLITSGASALTVTLQPAARWKGKRLIFKKVDSGVGVITVDGDGAENVDGATTQTPIGTQNYAIEYLSDGTAWHSVSRRAA